MTADSQNPDISGPTTGQRPGEPSAEQLELRIALVCYGGVSLAIYMHGVTKELQSLLRASRAFDQAFVAASTAEGLSGSPLRPTEGTEAAYYDELVELSRSGVPVSATVDVIAGTSAGGINGICLAKAAVRNASQDALTDLWMRKGDISQLMRYGRFGARMGAAVTALRLPRKARTTWSPLKGDDMSRWLFDALADMDANHGSGTLLPADGTVDLHVTATDVEGTHRIVSLGTGANLHDRTHQRVFSFRYGPSGEDTIGEGDRGVLAYAARATSSFPGAFPTVSLTDFAASVSNGRQQPSFDPAEVSARHMPEFDHTPDVDPARLPMMDGGLLANAPFGPVVDSIAAKPARRQVSRHLLFVEPDPGAASVGATLESVRRGSGPQGGSPSWAGTLWSAQTIRTQQPLTGAIQRLGELNEQVATIGEVILSLRNDVERTLREEVQLDLDSAAELTFEDLASYADTVYGSVPGIAGRLNHRVYGRLKMARVAARLAADLAEHLAYPETSAEASFLHAALLEWTHSCSEWNSEDDGAMDRWLEGLDAPYRERRLEFLIDGVNLLFQEATSDRLAAPTPTGPGREQLSTAKDVAWRLLVEERAKPGQAVSMLGDESAFASRSALEGAVLTEDPRRWAAEHTHDIERLVAAYREKLISLTANSAQLLWEAFTETTREWRSSDARSQLASRYAGFPLWDALLFPAQSLSRLALYNPIRISRVSPVDATAFVETNKAATKLLGVSFHHFGAFFALERRENDYLWGRLDGAELILRLLREQYDTRREPDSPDLGRSEDILRAAFGAVLDQEQLRLTEPRTQRLMAQLREKLPDVTASAGAGTANRTE